MIGKIFITSSGYDPERGKHVKDPYLGPTPSLGICHGDIRRTVAPGDWIFVISGKLRADLNQYIIGGFEVDRRVHAKDAYSLFPERRLRKLEDGQIDGNIIVDEHGAQHPLDAHKGFERRQDNYIVGKNPIAMEFPGEIARARAETLERLSMILGKAARSPVLLIGRGAKNLSAQQVAELVEWLREIKAEEQQRRAG